jgi:hypothetical protein
MSTLPIATGLRQLAVETDAVYIAGFPLHVAVTITGAGNATFRRLPFADFVNAAGAFGFTLSSLPHRNPVLSTAPEDVLDEDLGMSAVTLRPGEQRRMLIDLSSFFPGGAQPGEFEGILSYGPLETRTVSEPFRFVVYAPTDGQRAELAALGSELQQSGTWGQWTLRPPRSSGAFAAPDEADPLRFNRIVKSLLFVKEFSLASLRILGGIYRPEAAALAADFLAGQPDENAFRNLAADIRQRFPGLEWWLKKTESGASRVIFYRKNL